MYIHGNEACLTTIAMKSGHISKLTVVLDQATLQRSKTADDDCHEKLYGYGPRKVGLIADHTSTIRAK